MPRWRAAGCVSHARTVWKSNGASCNLSWMHRRPCTHTRPAGGPRCRRQAGACAWRLARTVDRGIGHLCDNATMSDSTAGPGHQHWVRRSAFSVSRCWRVVLHAVTRVLLARVWATSNADLAESYATEAPRRVCASRLPQPRRCSHSLPRPAPSASLPNAEVPTVCAYPPP